MRIVMPRLGVNDDYIVLAQWLKKDGSEVKKGQKIAVIETTKETSEISAEQDGYLTCLVKAGLEVKVGDDIALIEDTVAELKNDISNDLSEYKITEKAKRIIEENDIDISIFPKDKLIKEKDVLQFVKKPYEIAEIKTNQILIYGGGGFGKIAIDIIKKTPGVYIHGIVDINYPEKKDTMGVPVIGNDDDLERLYQEGYNKIFNAVGFKNKAHFRKKPYEMLKEKGFECPNIIHPSAQVEETVRMGEGNLVCAGAIIGSEAVLGSNCIINAGAVISHECIISDHCHIASGAVLAGMVTVGENTLIGQNCTIYSNVKIGKNVVIQNGCNIFKDVNDNEIVLLEKP